MKCWFHLLVCFIWKSTNSSVYKHVHHQTTTFHAHKTKWFNSNYMVSPVLAIEPNATFQQKWQTTSVHLRLNNAYNISISPTHCEFSDILTQIYWSPGEILLQWPSSGKFGVKIWYHSQRKKGYFIPNADRNDLSGIISDKSQSYLYHIDYIDPDFNLSKATRLSFRPLP